jgi:hypothetical protein
MGRKSTDDGDGGARDHRVGPDSSDASEDSDDSKERG